MGDVRCLTTSRVASTRLSFGGRSRLLDWFGRAIAFGFVEVRSRLLDWFGRVIAFGFVEAIAFA